jgi:hypothetical protein
MDYQELRNQTVIATNCAMRIALIAVLIYLRRLLRIIAQSDFSRCLRGMMVLRAQ